MKVSRLVLISTLISGTSTLVAAQSPGWTPVLELRVVAAAPDGDRTTTSNSWPLEANGQPVTNTIVASSTLCSTGGGNDDIALRSPQPDNIWKFSAALEGVDSKGYRVRVTSQFDRLAAGAVPAPWTQQFVFREGEEVTIDTIRAASDGPCHIRTLTMRARLLLRATDPAAQAARYTADVWLVHTDVAGAERRQHIVLNLDGSGPTSFLFNSVGFALPQLSPLQGDLEAFIQVGGALRARARVDGLIDLDVDTARQIGLHHPSTMNDRPFPRARGQKNLTLKNDETVAIDLPIPSGYSMLALTAAARFNVGVGTRAGAGGVAVGAIATGATGAGGSTQPSAPTVAVEVKNDVMRFNTGLFFKGHKAQLLIRLHKTRE